MGPLLFSLVLHKLIHTIIEDKKCSQLLINTWYLGDGILSGTKSVICRAVTLIQKLGPALGLWINPAKCEWFSRTVWSDFSQEMKVSHELNFEVLGAPIGDPIFCANFLTQRRAKAVKLLSQLVTVGSLDPQVALLLLRQCAGYCKLVHLARSAPPPLSLIGWHCLMLHDIRRCFSECTEIDTADNDWLQVQLSLGRGGLGLRSLALHSPAAYLASLIKAGSLTPSDNYALESITIFNDTVPPVYAISGDLLLHSSLSRKDLSARLENHQLPLPTVHVCYLCPHTMLHLGCQSSLK